MFKLFGKKSDPIERNLLEIELKEPVDCICDFTYNFHWQHNGEKLDPSWKVPDTCVTFGELVDHLKNGFDIKIHGNVGHRLGSSLGIDLVYFGGNGKELNVGDIYVNGDVDTRMGISMTRGQIYVSGNVSEPMGNIVEVESDVDEYRKFRSITDILSNGLKNDKPIDFQLEGNKLFIDDGTVKDTVGARLDKEVEVVLNGNVDLSTGILMRKGTVKVNGNAGKNSGALLNGGKLVINGDTDDFTGIDMIKGLIVINGNAGKFMGANKKNGTILAIKGNPIPPTSINQVETSDLQQLINLGFNPSKFKKFQ